MNTTAWKQHSELDQLLAYLKDQVESGLHKVVMRFSAGDGRRFALINELAVILNTTYEDSEVVVVARIDPADVERLKRLPGSMQVENASPTA